MAERIGFIGLGTMGGPMCGRLIEAGYDVAVFDIDGEALDRAVDQGASAVADARACASESDVLLTSLPRPDHVLSVMGEPGEALQRIRPGSLWVDLTTNDREVLIDLAAAAPAGVTICDAPVTGAVDGARQGALTIFLGGGAADRERVRPILRHLGRVIDCGPLGTGNVVKLVTNQLWFVHAAAIGEAFALGMANGVELGTVWEAIKDSVADSFVARHDAPSIFAGHYDPSFTLDLCLKDLDLIEGLSGAVAAELPMTDAARDVFLRAGDRYGRAAGEMHVTRQLEEDSGLTMRLDGEWTPHWER